MYVVVNRYQHKYTLLPLAVLRANRCPVAVATTQSALLLIITKLENTGPSIFCHHPILRLFTL